MDLGAGEAIAKRTSMTWRWQHELILELHNLPDAVGVHDLEARKTAHRLSMYISRGRWIMWSSPSSATSTTSSLGS